MLQVPVTVLTGFLGAGKTTLLNRILTEKHGKKYAVLINEFAEMGIDDQLVVQTDEEVFEMNNGCICCTVRGDLVRTIEGLMRRTDKFDGMIIETTGLAEPAPVAQTFFADEDVKRFAKLDAIVTVADAKHLPQHWDTPEAIEQLAFADIIVLNKTDLVSPEELAEVESRIRAINGQAKLHRTTNCQVDIDQVLNRAAFDLSKIKMDEAEDHHGHDHGHDHVHDEHCGHDHSHDHHHHHHHDHASGVTSLSLKTDKPIDPDRFEPWIGRVLQLYGADIFRSKGIMNVAGASKRLVFQGVHMQMEHRWGEAWRGRDTRESRIVFIGRNLPAEQLREGFLACVK